MVKIILLDEGSTEPPRLSSVAVPVRSVLVPRKQFLTAPYPETLLPGVNPDRSIRLPVKLALEYYTFESCRVRPVMVLLVVG
jgi:hypothetical protein